MDRNEALKLSGCAPLLQVFDMPTSIAFYCGVLGFSIVSKSSEGDVFDWALLSSRGTEIMLNTAYEADSRPPSPDPARIAAHSDTILYFGCRDVDAAYALLQAKGVKTKPPEIAPYGMKQLYLTDPDGYALCFQWPANEAQKNAWRERYGMQDL